MNISFLISEPRLRSRDPHSKPRGGKSILVNGRRFMLLFNLAPAAICASSELNSAPTSLCYLTPIVGEERYRIDRQQFTLWPVHDSNYDIRVARAHSSPTINAGARNCGGTKSMKICFRKWSTWRTQSLRSFVQSPSQFFAQLAQVLGVLFLGTLPPRFLVRSEPAFHRLT